MSQTDEAAWFRCADVALLGVLSVPSEPADTGVVVVVGGPQYRVGSHRQFVLLARALATAGYPVLRFDYRGMGDSGGSQREFQSVTEDIGSAISCLSGRFPNLKRVVLWGLCDGASAALIYCHDTQDPRVGGLCLLNPWVRSDASLAETHVKHYYAQRLMQREFWAKLVRGEVLWKAPAEFLRSVHVAASGAAPAPDSYQQRMASAWASFTGGLLLILSGQDFTAKEFLGQLARERIWVDALRRPRLTRLDLPQADHTFSDTASRRAVEASTVNWITREVARNDIA
jgi:uncharacterized protein